MRVTFLNQQFTYKKYMHKMVRLTTFGTQRDRIARPGAAPRRHPTARLAGPGLLVNLTILSLQVFDNK